VPSRATFLGNKAHDSDAHRSQITAQGDFAHTRAQRNRDRGLATRYDKRSDNLVAVIKLFCTRLWIVANKSTA
jgi:hypothetical protein